MLTRLRVNGFKNLREIDIEFGLFTCIAGANGVGKSNLFDAISFLSDLSCMPIVKAAGRVRGTNGRVAEFGNLFTNGGNQADLIEFVVELLVPGTVVDDFDRSAKPSATFLEYTLKLRLNRGPDGLLSKEPIRIEREELRALPSSEADRLLSFPESKQLPKKFVFGPGNRKTPFISTEESNSEPVLRLHGEGQSSGTPFRVPAHKSPQTLLSGVNLASHPTALAVRREMQSWRLLQLEPTALRKADEFTDDAQISTTGEHIPNALQRLQKNAQVVSLLAELIPGVVSVDVESDEMRQQRTLQVTMQNGQPYSASSLSDGTLRFLALSVLASDPSATGLTCMEEPENGIHPLRIPEMLKLVRSLSDADFAADDWTDRTGIRQVIINTHSPLVVGELPNEELLMAETLRFKTATFINFKAMRGTWRNKLSASKASSTITRGELENYLSGIHQPKRPTPGGRIRVRDQLTGDLFWSEQRGI